MNVLALPQAPTVRELAALGVARISWGSLLKRWSMEQLAELLADAGSY